MATVRQMIAALQKQNPDALVLWAGGSCVAEAVSPSIKTAKVTPINEHHFSLLGADRKTAAVLIDIVPA